MLLNAELHRLYGFRYKIFKIVRFLLHLQFTRSRRDVLSTRVAINSKRSISADAMLRYSRLCCGCSMMLKLLSASSASFTVAIGVLSSCDILLIKSSLSALSFICAFRLLYVTRKAIAVSASSTIIKNTWAQWP